MRLAAVVLGSLVAFGLLYQALATIRDRRRFPAPGRLMDVGGYRLHINCMGEGAPTVVFESGAGNSSLSWSLVQPEVAKFTRACAYDRVGMGWSDKRGKPGSVTAYVAELRTLLDRTDTPGPYVLVAHSLGGLLALHFASEYPRDVAGFVFVDCGYKAAYERMEERIPNMHRRIKRQTRLLPVGYAACWLGIVRLLGRRIFGPKNPPEARAAQIGQLQPKLLWGMADQGQLVLPNELSRARSEAPADVPAIVLSHGDPKAVRFRGIPPEESFAQWQELQQSLAAMFRSGVYRLVEGSGHHIQIDRPDAVVEAIRDVVEEARAARRQPSVTS